MSTRTSGYSLRLRSRGNAKSSADNDAAGSRTALVSDNVKINEVALHPNIPRSLLTNFFPLFISSH